MDCNDENKRPPYCKEFTPTKKRKSTGDRKTTSMTCDERDRRPPVCKEFRPQKQAKPVAEAEEPESSKQKESFTESFLKEFRMPWIIRNHGPAQMEVIKYLSPGFAMYSLATLLAVIYICDWRVIVKKMPYYNGKFADEKESDD